MKTKLSIIIMEVMHSFDRYGPDNTRYVIDDNNNFISKYISVKDVDETIQDLLYEYTNIDIRLYYPKLVDFFHEASSSECEVVYLLKLPKDVISLKKGKLLTSQQFKTEDKYGRAIRKTAKSI